MLFLSQYEAHLRIDLGLSANTIHAYVSDLRDCANHLFSKHPEKLVTATPADLKRYFLQLAQEKANRRTLCRRLSALRSFYCFLLQEGQIKQNPAQDIELPSPPRSIPKNLSFDEVQRLLDAPAIHKKPVDAIMLRTLYATGMRVSELIGVGVEDIDFNQALFRVKGKGSKVRLIPIDPETARQIQWYVREIRHQTQGPLFLTNREKGYTRQGFWKLIKKYASLAQIQSNVSPHVLRHAFASHLLERGMNLRTLQALLGHSDISTTEIYTHVAASHLREAINHHPRVRKGQSTQSKSK